MKKKRIKRYQKLFICDKDKSHTKPYRGELSARETPWLRCECGGSMDLVSQKLVDGQWTKVEAVHKKRVESKEKKSVNVSLEKFAHWMKRIGYDTDKERTTADSIWLRKIGRPGVRQTIDGEKVRVDQRVEILKIADVVAIRLYGAVGWSEDIKALARRHKVPISIKFFNPLIVRPGEKNGHNNDE